MSSGVMFEWRCAVASVVRRSERARQGVAAVAVACSGLAAHFDRHLTAVVERSSIVQDQLVRALRCSPLGCSDQELSCLQR